jgi:hypothetical protein
MTFAGIHVKEMDIYEFLDNPNNCFKEGQQIPRKYKDNTIKSGK